MASFSNFKSSIVQSSQTAAGVASGGVTVYADTDALPYVGNSDGDQAFVASNNRLYIWQGSGWYNVALINRAPTIASVQDSDGNTTPFTLSSIGTVTTITITAADSDGDPITYSATADSDFTGLASITDDGNEFTITPFSSDSASTTSGTITFRATDGVNIAASGVQTFTLIFLSSLWDEVALSIGTSSTDGLNNSTFIDRSTNAHPVTLAGSPAQTAFHPYLDYWSVEFDGTGDYLTVPTSLTDNDFTVEGWLRIETSSSSNKYIFLHAPSGSTTSGSFLIYIRLDTFYVQWGSGGSYFQTSYSGLKNQWFHFAVTYNKSSETVTGYLNGTQVGTFSAISRFIGSDNTSIGHRDGGGTFDGYISNLRVTNGSVVYTENFIPPTEPLTAITNTSLLTCQSNRFIDNSSNAHAITVNGDPKVSAYNPFGQESEYAVGENKGSAYFDGSGDYLSITDDGSFDFGTGDFTIETWIYATSSLTSSNLTIIDARPASGSTTGNYYFLISSTGKLRLIHALGASDIVYESTSTLSPNQWYHVAVSRSGDNLRLFIDGDVENTTSVSGKSFNATLFNIGYKSYTTSSLTYWPGYFSDLRIIKGTATYTSAFTPPTAPVSNTNASLYLPMDNAGIFDKTGIVTLIPSSSVATSTTQTKFADTAMYFDGTGDAISTTGYLGDAISLGDYTLEFWFYAPSFASDLGLVGNRKTSFGSSGWQLTTSGSIISFFPAGYGVSSITSSSGTATNTWHHIALVNNSNTITLYLNGSSVGSQSVSSYTPSNEQLQIGRRHSTDTSTVMNGYIENLQILKGVAKYTANFTPPSRTQGRIYQAES